MSLLFNLSRTQPLPQCRQWAISDALWLLNISWKDDASSVSSLCTYCWHLRHHVWNLAIERLICRMPTWNNLALLLPACLNHPSPGTRQENKETLKVTLVPSKPCWIGVRKPVVGGKPGQTAALTNTRTRCKDQFGSGSGGTSWLGYCTHWSTWKAGLKVDWTMPDHCSHQYAHESGWEQARSGVLVRSGLFESHKCLRLTASPASRNRA